MKPFGMFGQSLVTENNDLKKSFDPKKCSETLICIANQKKVGGV